MEQDTTNNSIPAEVIQVLSDLVQSQEDLPPEFSEILNGHFWNLI